MVGEFDHANNPRELSAYTKNRKEKSAPRSFGIYMQEGSRISYSLLNYLNI
jgi:hypothetical protein